MKHLQLIFIGKYLARSSDPFEKAKIILCFRFAFIYLFLSLPSFPICVIFNRWDIFGLTAGLVLLGLAAIYSLSVQSSYRLASIFLAASCISSAIGHSLMASTNLSIIIFIWPIIGAVFLNFTLGKIYSFWYIVLFSFSVIAISVLHLTGIIFDNPVDEHRILYSTGLIVIIASIILYQLLAQFNNTINEAIQSKITSDENRENIIHVVVHDLRNSLGAITTSTELIKMSIKEGNQHESLYMLDLLGKASKDAVTIISNLTEAASIGKDCEILQKQNINLCNLVRETVEIFIPMAVNKKITLSFNNYCLDGAALGDPDKLKRAIGNIISNAIKFTKTGGVVQVLVRDTTDTIKVSVKDSGIGIPQSLQNELFKKYTSASRKGTNGEHTTGLGMYIIKNLLDLHNAPVSIDSRENKGTEISFELSR